MKSMFCSGSRWRPLALPLPLFAVLIGSTDLRAQELIIEDSLLGTTKGVYEGDPAGLTEEGFKPHAAHLRSVTGLLYRVGHILYELPFTISEGRMEVEIRDFDPSGLNPGTDHGFLVQYDGRGILEPAVYDLFKSNFFRWNVHWREEASAVKAVLSLAEPVKEREEATLAIFPGAGDDIKLRDFTSEPTGKGHTWQPGKWHTLSVEWRNKVYEVKIDGASRWKVTGPWEYRPVVHRIWVGSGPGKYSNNSASMVMRNFKLFAFRKETLRKDNPPPLNQMPRVPQPLPDAGAPAPSGGQGGVAASPPDGGAGQGGGSEGGAAGEQGGADNAAGSTGAGGSGGDDSTGAAGASGGASGESGEDMGEGGSRSDGQDGKGSGSGCSLATSGANTPFAPWLWAAVALWWVGRRGRGRK